MFQTSPEIIGKDRAVAFSGHRRIVPSGQLPLFGSPAGNVTRREYEIGIKDALDRTLEKLVREGGYDTFLCGMATGFDLMAGLSVCDMIDAGEDISLIAAIPYPGQADRFPHADRTVYDHILHYASLAHTVCGDYRADCFHRRNDFLVENSSVLVCFYNGSPGGTQYTVKKAFRHGLRIINLY